MRKAGVRTSRLLSSCADPASISGGEKFGSNSFKISLRVRVLESKRQDLFGTWSKITHDCTFDAGAGSLTLWKVDPASTLQDFNTKTKRNRTLT
jgi:hypothetical protein